MSHERYRHAFDAVLSTVTGRAMPSPETKPYCHTCENGGWVQVFSHWPPALGICQTCFNPEGHESP